MTISVCSNCVLSDTERYIDTGTLRETKIFSWTLHVKLMLTGDGHGGEVC
jgi:hypothetical protein